MFARQKYLSLAAVVAALVVTLTLGVMNAGAAVPQGTAEISAPAANAQLRGSVTIQGTASAVKFQFYKVEIGVGATPSNYSVIGDLQKSQVIAGTLAVWNTTLVPDGAYTLKLTVVDNTGNYLEATRAVQVANTAPAAAPEPPRRGCLSCHVKVAPDGRYTLAHEAKVRAEAGGGTHPTQSPSGISIAATEQTSIAPCLECHAPGTGARAGKGVIAPLALRDIVHPAHMFSETFKEHYAGNCFTCHNVNGQGGWDILVEKVDVNEKGVPQVAPIPGAIAAP
ncbi:MAG: hypothetical protein ACYC4L_01660 [Chloroflexota bacterium]